MGRLMKDSGVEWIGDIPEDWELAKYKRFAKSGMGKTLLREDVLEIPTEMSVPVYSATETGKVFGYLENPTLQLTKGDFVIPARGNSIGAIKIINDILATCTQTTIYSKIKGINHKFLFYCGYGLRDNWFEFDQTAIPQITVNQVQNNILPLPQETEQDLIVEVLDRKTLEIENIITKTNQSIAAFKRYKQALITETITKGLNPNVPMKDSGIEWIGSIPEHWELRKMKSLGASRNGLTYSPDDLVDSDSGTLVLRSSNVQNSKLYLNDNVYVSKNINSKLLVEKGDILICSRNGSRELIGKSAIIDSDINASFGAFMMIFKPKYNSKYIYYILNSEVFKYYLGTFLTSTINQLTKNNFQNMEVVFCSELIEQQQIADFLDEKTAHIDSLIKNKEEMVKKLEVYKKSLIYEYVTGKKEVD